MVPPIINDAGKRWPKLFANLKNSNQEILELLVKQPIPKDLPTSKVITALEALNCRTRAKNHINIYHPVYSTVGTVPLVNNRDMFPYSIKQIREFLDKLEIVFNTSEK